MTERTSAGRAARGLTPGENEVYSGAIENKTPVGAGAYDQRSVLPVIDPILTPDSDSRNSSNDPIMRALGIIQEKLAARYLYLNSLPYDEYLQTKDWQRRRLRALRRAEFRCELCFSPDSLQVHHKTYEHRGYEADCELIVLCSDCHAKFHDKLPAENE